MSSDIALEGKQSKCLVFGVTANLSFALGSFLIGYIRHNPDWNGFVHVFHNGLSLKDQEVICQIWPATTFCLLTTDMIAVRLKGSPELGDAVEHTIARYSSMYFAKLEMFDLAQVYDQCIWFDVDMVVQRTIPELWTFSDLAWRKVLLKTANKHRDIFEGYSDILKEHPVSRPNAGLICISKNLWRDHKINAQTLYDNFIDIISRKQIVTGDEISIMLMASQHKLAVRDLNISYNCPSASRKARSAFVVHSIGPQKFWNDGAISAAFPVWREYYDIWIEQGGGAYEGHVDNSYIPLETNEIVTRSRALRKRRDLLETMRSFIPNDLAYDPFSSGHGDLRFYITGHPPHLRISISPAIGAIETNRVDRVFLDLEMHGSDDLNLVLRVKAALASTMPINMDINLESLNHDTVRICRRKIESSDIVDSLRTLIALARSLA
jgi:lipopolysaccharide biosynthesis glycosyltransferase